MVEKTLYLNLSMDSTFKWLSPLTSYTLPQSWTLQSQATLNTLSALCYSYSPGFNSLSSSCCFFLTTPTHFIWYSLIVPFIWPPCHSPPPRSLPQTCWQEQMHLNPSQDPPLMDMAATVYFRPWTVRGVGTEAAVCPPLWWTPLSGPTTWIQTVHVKLNKLISCQSKAQKSFHIWLLC